MSYVGEHNQFFVDVQLRNTKIIIDGNNLYHRLYFDSNLDLCHGGDYDSFADVIHKFFVTLTLCNIQPYVLLDGGNDVRDKKLETLKERAQERIQTAYSLSCSGGGNLLPLLIREVFKQSLTKLHVPFVQSLAEADRDIVALANQWNCPVLTIDSDFCIFDLKGGYCPLNYFQWRNLGVDKDSKDCYIPARCFAVERLCRHFNNMNKALLPLFAVISGNDYINLPALETFFRKIRLPGGGGYVQRGRRHFRIQGLLNWLSCFADPAEAIENVLSYLKKQDKEETRQLLCSAMEDYKPSDVNLEDFFKNGIYASETANQLQLSPWILTALTKGLLAPFISDALVLRRTILHVQVENMQRPSAHTTTLPIRQVIYGLLNTTGRASIFHEFDRLQKALKKSSISAAALPERFCGDRYSLATLNEVTA